MCGILGQVNVSQPVSPERFLAMRDTMVHRGPDGAGFEAFEGGRVALGHRRLAIIDTGPAGHQPMANEDGSVWVTFGGEIYNHAALRRELSARGHVFRSRCDTEVLVHGWEEWGPALLGRLRGMFAFGLWDRRTAELFVARDRLGIKPLYWFQDGERLIFASEIKGIVTDPSVPRRLDVDSVADFLVYRFIPAPGTIWQDVRELPPGCFLRLREGKAVVERWWSPASPAGAEGAAAVAAAGAADAAGAVDAHLTRAIEEHLISDVPVGVLLSGGIDSSALAVEMAARGHRASFSLGFEGWEKTELEDARLVADHLALDHHEVRVGAELLDRLDTLAWHFDEPLGGSSMLPTHALSELAASHVKVALGGDGGDEAFGGYARYERALTASTRPRWRRALDAARGRGAAGLARRYFDEMSWAGFDYAGVASLLAPDVARELTRRNDLWLYERFADPSAGPVRGMQLLDVQTFLPGVILAKVDRAAMACSLEVRVPFLDHELVELMLAVPEAVALAGGTQKRLLRDRLAGRVPQRVFDKPKQGFGSPVHRWLKGSPLVERLRDGRLVSDGLVRADVVQGWLERRATRPLWALLVLEAWAARWL